MFTVMLQNKKKKHFNLTPTQWRDKDVYQQSVNYYAENQKQLKLKPQNM